MMLTRFLGHTRRPRSVVRLLRCGWVLLLFIGEIGLYIWHIERCQWPTNGTEAAASHVAIVADPQIVDHYSYGQTGPLLRIVQFFTDIYIRKAYLLLQDIQQPSTVVFLGDLMDGGREWDDSAWLEEYSRYQSIFSNRDPESRRVYDMAGNHDIGIGNTVVPEALRRFHQYVGPTNQVIDIGGHALVLLDTLTLESDDPEVSSSSRKLVEWLQAERAERAEDAEDATSVLPRLLFTHVPMWRADGTDCGPLRQSRLRALQNRRGYQFRDQLFQNTTERLLEAVRPAAVFSGDDHDTCTVQHHVTGSENAAVPEYTIGAFGWASGVPIASYALLSLYHHADTEGGASFVVQNCYLPYQLGIYKCYAAALALSLLLLAYACWCQRRHRWNSGSSTSDHQQKSLLPTVSLSAAQLGSKASSSSFIIALDVLRGIRNIALVAGPAYVAFILLFYMI